MNFTDREKQVLSELYAHDCNVDTVCNNLGITRSTYTAHIGKIFAVVGAKNLPSLMVKLFKAGWFQSV